MPPSASRSPSPPLKSSTAPLSSKSVTIYLNRARYNDVTKTTDASGTATFTRKWTPAGKRLYYATFVGDTRLVASRYVFEEHDSD